MTLLAIFATGLVVVLFLRSVHHHAAIRRDWEFITAPWAAVAVEDCELKAAAEDAVISSAYRRAARAEQQGLRDEAVRLMDLGLKLIEATADDWLTLLRATSLLSRMASAVTPLSPLDPWAFNAPALSGLALVASMLHYVLVTTGERLRLRAYVLRGCWALARKRLLESTTRIRGGEDAWSRLEHARRDIATTRNETLRSFHAAVLSIGARPTRSAITAAARRS